MAIVPLQRVTLIGELRFRDKVIFELQRMGCVHVVDRGDADERTDHTAMSQNDLKSAIAFLQRCPEQRPPFSHSATSDEIKRIAEKVLQTESESRALAEERESLAETIEQNRPWGNFQLPSPDELRGFRLFFYRLTPRQVRELVADVKSNFNANRINRDRQHEYWVIIADQPPAGMPCEPEVLDARPLEQLNLRLFEIDQRREALQVERIALTRWLDHLEQELGVVQDETARAIATKRSRVDGPVFALQGWIPARQMASLETFARENMLVCLSRAPKTDEQPPTLLSNPRPIAGAEGAVTFFMTPGYRAWDPTWVMYFSFAAFFAMILADAGYGLVLGVILACLAPSLGRTEAGQRFRQLATFMVLVTIVYGLAIGSFFGFTPAEGSWLDSVVIKSNGRSIMQDREAMMLVSATIGVFHLVLANAVVAWRWLGSGYAFSSVGWAIALIGGWLLALAQLPKPDVMALLADWLGSQASQWTEAVTQTGSWMLGSGLVLVFLFSSVRPVFSPCPRDWLWRGLDGLMGLTSVSKAFGDALSYLRLFALGLASAQLAIVFNQLASDAARVQGAGILLGTLVFLLGHTLNLLLAVVGGVVHGLRLNCIEFFSWSLTDEGQPFEALEMKANK
ncbi:V-type ATP synthase subunit I [Novipirellula artificiosorum]|uniref:V-type ATP synthase subunit I n=1 Tax=Novipirellula artificiosorum TaxID=2528016 RepID=A0A5C6D6K9_9BACT|nr:V-type ATP synthase subunit I [Novipirellula artificiosorum]TWU32460.1 V-type ATP synthase subunit I [Novipirellula artificiosorum]